MKIDVEPTWYFYSMHFTAVLTTPINFMGVLIILFCQKTKLKSLRWHLLTYQICSMITDFMMSIGSLPVVYTPFAIGRPHGILNRVFQFFGAETSTEAQSIMVFVSIFITAGSVELLFFLRYQSILPYNHPHKLSALSSILLIGTYQITLIACMIISFHYTVPDQHVARARFATLYPDLQYLVNDKHVFFVGITLELMHIIFLFICGFRLGFGLTIVIVLVWMLSRSLKKFNLSPKTRKMHWQVVRSLCFQISVPIVAFYVPLLIVVLPLMFTIPNTQMSFFISLLCMSLHTSLGTISMLFFNRHYRQWVIAIIEKKALMTSIPVSKN